MSETDTSAGIGNAWASNNKLTYDQVLSLCFRQQDQAAAAQQALITQQQQIISQLQVELARNNAIANQSVQNAVENANLAAKQALRHSEVVFEEIVDEINDEDVGGSGAQGKGPTGVKKARRTVRRRR